MTKIQFQASVSFRCFVRSQSDWDGMRLTPAGYTAECYLLCTEAYGDTEAQAVEELRKEVESIVTGSLEGIILWKNLSYASGDLPEVEVTSSVSELSPMLGSGEEFEVTVSLCQKC